MAERQLKLAETVFPCGLLGIVATAVATSSKRMLEQRRETSWLCSPHPVQPAAPP